MTDQNESVIKEYAYSLTIDGKVFPPKNTGYKKTIRYICDTALSSPISNKAQLAANQTLELIKSIPAATPVICSNDSVRVESTIGLIREMVKIAQSVKITHLADRTGKGRKMSQAVSLTNFLKE